MSDTPKKSGIFLGLAYLTQLYTFALNTNIILQLFLPEAVGKVNENSEHHTEMKKFSKWILSPFKDAHQWENQTKS